MKLQLAALFEQRCIQRPVKQLSLISYFSLYSVYLLSGSRIMASLFFSCKLFIFMDCCSQHLGNSSLFSAMKTQNWLFSQGLLNMDLHVQLSSLVLRFESCSKMPKQLECFHLNMGNSLKMAQLFMVCIYIFIMN